MAIKYQPLINYLAGRTEASIALTFPEIEAIIGVPLAQSAHVETYYWMGRTLAYVRRWRALGWTARLDRRNRCVIFTRGEKQ